MNETILAAKKVDPLVVAKFGGTSMGTVESMRQCAFIVENNPLIKVVVVSATSGTTSLLIELAELSSKGEKAKADEICQIIGNRHLKMAQELDVSEFILGKIHELLDEMKTMSQGMLLLKEASLRSRDALYSLGERLSSLLFSAVLKKGQFFDVREVMKTDNNFGKALVNTAELKKLAKNKLPPLWANSSVVVAQGFIGETKDGQTTTLGRGGSDYSAALLAEALEANHVEIWTDVSGMYTLDPKISPRACAIAEISFEEAAEMCNFGAKVLHPATLWPAIRQSIPVFVGNTFDAKSSGTWVRRHTPYFPLVRAISLRDKQKLLTLTSLSMLHAHGFLSKVFAILARHQISVDLITTSEISIALTIDRPTLLTDEILKELSAISEVKLEENLSVVAIIGNGLSETPGLMAKIFSTLENFNIRMICLGAGRHNLCLLVDHENSRDVARILHQKFLEKGPATNETQNLEWQESL